MRRPLANESTHREHALPRSRDRSRNDVPCAADLSSVRSVTGGAQVGCTGRYACAPTCSCVFLFLSPLPACLSLHSRRVRVSYPQLPSLAPSRPLFLLLLSLPPSSRSRFLQRAGIRKIDTRDRSPRERASERASECSHAFVGGKCVLAPRRLRALAWKSNRILRPLRRIEIALPRRNVRPE